jgi:hypothetical protein
VEIVIPWRKRCATSPGVYDPYFIIASRDELGGRIAGSAEATSREFLRKVQALK